MKNEQLEKLFGVLGKLNTVLEKSKMTWDTNQNGTYYKFVQKDPHLVFNNEDLENIEQVFSPDKIDIIADGKDKVIIRVYVTWESE